MTGGGWAQDGISHVLFELTTLACPLLSLGEAAAAARDWVAAADGGTLLGCWRTDLGTLGRVLLLRSFDEPEQMTAERRRALLSPNPFNAGRLVTALRMDSYALFPFLPVPTPRALGATYEFRTYELRPGGLAPTLAAWEQALPQAGDYAAHLVVNMYALDGPPRITHVWGFASLEQRGALRAQAYAAGVWPPRGGPDQILEATSTIGVPEPWSPLR